jgi:hypothetical protein
MTKPSFIQFIGFLLHRCIICVDSFFKVCISPYLFITVNFNMKQTSECCSCRWGEPMSLNCDYHWAYCSPLSSFMWIESSDGMILIGEIEELAEKPVPVWRSPTISSSSYFWLFRFRPFLTLHAVICCDLESSLLSEVGGLRKQELSGEHHPRR